MFPGEIGPPLERRISCWDRVSRRTLLEADRRSPHRVAGSTHDAGEQSVIGSKIPARSRYGSDLGLLPDGGGDHEDLAPEPSCHAPTTRMRRSRWWMRYSNRHPPSVSSALAECASLQNALVGEMLSILAAISSKTSNARKSKSAGASISAAK